MSGMPAAKPLFAELGLVTGAEADLELGPVPASEAAPVGFWPGNPS